MQAAKTRKMFAGVSAADDDSHAEYRGIARGIAFERNVAKNNIYINVYTHSVSQTAMRM